MKQTLFLIYFLLLSILTPSLVQAESTDKPQEQLESMPFLNKYQPEWFNQAEDGSEHVNLYFFWSRTCPHCRKALKFMPELKKQLPWLQIYAVPLDNRQNVQLFIDTADSIEASASTVPAFFFCEQHRAGYRNDESTGQTLMRELQTCYDKRIAQTTQNDLASPTTLNNEQLINPPQSETAPTNTTTEAVITNEAKSSDDIPTLQLPILGDINAQDFSLPMYTLVIAGLDAFNPCAFFVLLFLLSLLVNTRKRSRMLLIGGIFVFFSGFIYFLFMAAWLNIFKWLGELHIITLMAGVIAILIATINIKDYFWFKKGVSLSIPDQAKPSLYQRMRGLVNSTALVPLIISTIMLAIVANSYELLCTAGFPMVYTRILTLNELPESSYYLYLLFYNVVYVIPLLVIVLIFTYTLGSRKLAESEGRRLKLMSGLMMLGLGSILLFRPEWLTNIIAAILVLVSAVGLTILIVAWDKYRLSRT